MDFKTLDEWLEDWLIEIKEYTNARRIEREETNKRRKEDGLPPTYLIPSNEYKHHTEILAIELGEWLKLVSDNFKSRLIGLMNDYQIGSSFNHFSIIYKIVQANLILKNLYCVKKMPYSDFKYKRKLKTLANRGVKKGISEYFHVSPMDQVYFFKLKCEEMLSNFNFYHNQSTERDKIKIRNELIDELIELIVSDNYAHDKKYRTNTRISKRTKEFFDTETKILDLTVETHQTYLRKIEP